MIGWLLDTNVVASLIHPNGAPSVKAWAAAQRENDLFISVLTLGEYDRGISHLAADHADRARYAALRDNVSHRFEGRIVSVGDAVVRRWGSISGTAKRATGQAPNVVDALLAATAVEHDLYLVTRNAKDVKGLGAEVFNPWTDDPARFSLAVTRRSGR